MQRWQKLDDVSRHQHREGDYAGYRASRSAMNDMARGLERDPKMESILERRKRELGISFDSGRSLGRELALANQLELGRSRGIRI